MQSIHKTMELSQLFGPRDMQWREERKILPSLHDSTSGGHNSVPDTELHTPGHLALDFTICGFRSLSFSGTADTLSTDASLVGTPV